MVHLLTFPKASAGSYATTSARHRPSVTHSMRKLSVPKHDTVRHLR